MSARQRPVAWSGGVNVRCLHAPGNWRAVMIIGDGPAARREATRRNRGATKAIASPPLALPLHPDEHRSEYPVLLAVDQELGEDADPGIPQQS